MYDHNGEAVTEEDVLDLDERSWKPPAVLPSMLMVPINLKEWNAAQLQEPEM
jgi:hypothetical protein